MLENKGKRNKRYMINILYIHGLGSSSSSSTGQLLKSYSDNSITFFNPTFSLSPKKALEEINQFIKENDIKLVVGSSLGGFYALQSNCKYGVVINPALTPIKDIKESIGYGEHDCANDEGKYTIDDSFFSELEWIIKRNYKGEDLNSWYKEYDKSSIFGGIFGAKDELFSHFEDFHSINNYLITSIDDMSHRFDKKYIRLLLAYIVKILRTIHLIDNSR